LSAKGSQVSFQNSFPHAFTLASIRAHAPAAPGVYGLSNPRQWIYIGEAENIQQQLLQHISDANGLQKFKPTGFSYEVCAGAQRTMRYGRLIQEYGPVLNRTAGR